MQWHPFAILPLAGALITGMIAVWCWRYRSKSPTALYLALDQAASSWWALAVGLGSLFTSLDVQTAFGLAIYPAVSIVVIAFFWVAGSVANADYRPSRRAAVLLGIEPVLITAIAATNHWHHLLFTRSELVGDPGLAVHTVGPIFWLHSLYSYVFVFWSIGRLVGAWRHGSYLHRRYVGTILIAAFLPILANVVTMVRFAHGSSVDLAVLAFTVNGTIYWWAIRAGLLRLVPMARSAVMQRVSDAVIVVHGDGTVLDANPAARELAGRLRPNRVETLNGAQLGDFLPLAVAGGVLPDGEHVIGEGSHRMDLDVRGAALSAAGGRQLGWAYVIRDITQVNRHKRELIAANTRLSEQLTTIEKLSARLEEQAVRDELTGLFNRRHLNATLETRLAEARDTSAELAVVIIDIDHFKRVNDTYGHLTGDALLRAVAGTLSSAVRDDDFVARYGGEEFVVLLPATGTKQALRRAEQLRVQCSEVAVLEGGRRVATTISAGVATCPTMGSTSADLLRAADQALYQAKERGRNRVVLASA